MSTPLGAYTFLPFLRIGIANRIEAPAASARATVALALELEGTRRDGGTTTLGVPRSVELYGPGDIIGVDGAQISRMEPPSWTTNFEPNYLAAIEFYDEDFPWRYTPAAPEGRRLLPWLALVVLEEETEFRETPTVAGRPLPCIDVTGDFAEVFPNAAEGWAWAHVHLNGELSTAVVDTDAEQVSQKAAQLIESTPDAACSRLLCPRKLKPKTTYHAFLIPAFETGRLAGLGFDPKPFFEDAANGLSATSSAWGGYGVPANRPENTCFPFYHRWTFRTAERGDFESCVRSLRPKVVDSRVGHRDMDVTDPAPHIGGIERPELGGVLRLGGALQAPREAFDEAEQAEFDRYDRWAEPYPQPFQEQLAAFVNLADAYQAEGTAAHGNPALDPAVQADVDPLITPPLYGRWHALQERLLTERDGSSVDHPTNWVHDLNLDPRWRVAAGLGTKVVQAQQEQLMEAAWDQIGEVLEANRKVRQAQAAKAAGMSLHQLHLTEAKRVAPALALLLAAPLRARVVSEGLTLQHRLAQSPLGVTVTSSAMRRALRPRARLARRLGIGSRKDAAVLVRRVNDGEITGTPPKAAPNGTLSPQDLADALRPQGTWAALLLWLAAHPLWALLLLLLLLVLLFLLLGWSGLGAGLGAGLAALGLLVAVGSWRAVQSVKERQALADRALEEQLTPAAVDEMPGSRDFTLIPAVDPRDPVSLGEPLRPGETDNAEAERFKQALRDQYRVIEASRELGAVAEPRPLDLARVSQDLVAELRPERTVPRWVLSGIHVPARIREQIGDDFVEAMAYPEFDTPMYEPLAKAGSELFVPNLHLVEPDSVTLLETNQEFIEAYMVGLNHEFARELLWREYPTDQRGSYFRQFWDVRKKLAEAEDREAARERYKDIPPLHRWPRTNDLGDNDHREEGGASENELVLVIRGELLKKYPNTVISVQPAKWQLKEGRPDKTRPRVLDESVAPISPLYEARVSPDIHFFGFDLTALEARGDDTVDDRPGYFFRIEEVSGDARFGFDVERPPGSAIHVYNDLAWTDVMSSSPDGKHLEMSSFPTPILVEPPGSDPKKHEQWEYDSQMPWGSDVSSGELAYVALQTPVIMAIHASELLPDQSSAGGGHG